MIFGLVVCAVTLLFIWWYKRPSRFPPGPRGFPLLGTIPFMTRRPEIKFHQWSKKYGPIISARVGNKDWVILNSYDAIMEVMFHQGNKFAMRPPNYLFDVHLDRKDYGLVFSSGNIWEKNRKFGETTFRLFGVGKRVFEISVQEEAKIFIEHAARNVKVSREWSNDVKKAVGNIICRVIFGKRFDYTDKLFVISTQYKTDPWAALFFSLLTVLPWTRFLPPTWALLIRDAARLKDKTACYQEEVDRHKLALDPDNVRDFIDAFLIEQQQEEKETGKSTHFSNSQLLGCIHDLFDAGTVTSATTISWCLLGLLHHPDWQEMLQSEIRTVIGTDVPSLMHRDSMPLTQAFIQEIQRYCTIAPFATPHCATEDTTVLGYNIPKSTTVVMNIWSAHFDTKFFEKPYEFSPKRFVDTDGNFIRSRHVIPFAVGTRHCLGKELAKMELFIFLTAILQKFKIKVTSGDSGSLPAMDDGIFGIIYLPRPFKAMFVPFD